MGDPGSIFTKVILIKLVPHIGEKLFAMYTAHEEDEVGRLLERFGITQCGISYEILATCHKREKPIIFNINLLYAYHLASSNQLKVLSRISAKTDTYLVCEADTITYTSRLLLFYSLATHLAISGHS
uniref:Uncharacterized protein n=1 Tax=Pongo abelii TaxID=9601 RepID=A0A8I5TAM1_PONAB